CLERQPQAADGCLIGPQDARRRYAVIDGAGERHHVVLVHAVAADAEAADQGTGPGRRVPVQRGAAGEEDDAVLVGQVERVVEVRLREEGVVALDGTGEGDGRQRRPDLQAGPRVGAAAVEDRV